MENIFEPRGAKGLATILAIGTANPPNCYYQADYPDFYFKITQSDHLTNLKHKFKRICEKSMIKKRYLHLDEDTIKKNPNIGIFKAASLDARQEILVPEVPKLGKEAALKAIKEWGQPISKITHLIFGTTSSIRMPCADHELVKLLGLQRSVKKIMLYNQGCFTSAKALRIAKDIAENNAHSRILIVCSENTTICFQAPSESHLDVLIGSAIFSDGAAAVIVGADPDTSIEQPLFQVISASQTIVPDSEDEIVCHLHEMGLVYHLSKNIPQIIGNHIVQCMKETFSEIGYTIQDWNSLFYVVHPGGPTILNIVEEKLGLVEEKLGATRHVLSEYGNLMGPAVLFVLDEMRRRSLEQGKATTGEGLDFGVMLAFGPGVTVEALVLSSVAMSSNH